MVLPEDLETIVGERLSAVTFVQDYWQLDFDSTALTVMSHIAVESRYNRIRDGEKHFRDILCDRIGKLATRVELTSDYLAITFDDGSQIEASLRPQDYRGPKAIQLGLQGRIYLR